MADPLSAPQTPLAPTLNATEWRAAMGYFPSGVTVVTSWAGERPVGTTASSFCSVSLDPPLLLVCLDLANPVLAPIESCGRLGVNILSHQCRELALHFARNPEADRFADVAHRTAPDGAPQLDMASVFIDCTLEAAHPAGDHKILVGRGARISHNSAAPPLIYHAGAFPKLGGRGPRR